MELVDIDNDGHGIVHVLGASSILQCLDKLLPSAGKDCRDSRVEIDIGLGWRWGHDVLDIVKQSLHPIMIHALYHKVVGHFRDLGHEHRHRLLTRKELLGHDEKPKSGKVLSRIGTILLVQLSELGKQVVDRAIHCRGK